jgi:hypothetical protein
MKTSMAGSRELGLESFQPEDKLYPNLSLLLAGTVPCAADHYGSQAADGNTISPFTPQTIKTSETD